MANNLRIEAVVKLTGISQRNIKYWCNKYEIPVEKAGRSNIYPPETVNALRLVSLLSNSNFFNHRFIRLHVQRALGRPVDQLEFLEEYRTVRKEGAALLNQFSTLSGTTRLLPHLKKEKPRHRAAVSTSEAGEIDDVLL